MEFTMENREQFTTATENIRSLPEVLLRLDLLAFIDRFVTNFLTKLTEYFFKINKSI